MKEGDNIMGTMHAWVKTQDEFSTRQATDYLISAFPRREATFLRCYGGNVLKQLRKRGVLVVLKSGNHDAPNIWKRVP